MESTPASKAGRPAILVFLIAAVVLLASHGNRVVSTNDEGMILEPAQRMLAGARPYVDFFGYMSPGSYWLQELVFRVFGISLWSGRLPVILDFSVQAALVFWLVGRLASLRLAVAAALIFAGFQIADPNFLTTQHRWDSGTLALAGLCVAVHAWARRESLPRMTSFLWAVSGALMAAAAWCTPSLALVGAAIAFWLLIGASRRAQLLPWTAGVMAVTLAAVAALANRGSLGAFLEQIAWLKTNYSGLNFMPYGAVIGGYRALFGDWAGMESVVRAALVICFLLPAILPIAALIFSAIALWRGKVAEENRPVVQLLMLAVVAFVATVFPRADVMHLAFVAALPYGLTAIALSRLVPERAGMVVLSVALALATVFGANFFNTLRGTRLIPSPVGKLRVPAENAPEIETWMSQVRPGDSLFVYPYMPLQYFLTQARNPTRFSFLAPGMMTTQEASIALTELQADPPQWLTYLKLPRGEFLRVFPNASNLDWRFPALEDWIQENYQPVENPAVSVFGYQLWRRGRKDSSVTNIQQ